MPNTSFLRSLSLAVVLTLTSCGSTKAVLDIRSQPSGAKVYLRRTGEERTRGKFGPVSGDFESETFEEKFVLIGRTPLEYVTPLEEKEKGGTVFGVGAKVMREYEVGVIRIERKGFEPATRRVNLEGGKTKVHVQLEGAADDASDVSSDDSPAPAEDEPAADAAE